MARSGTAFKADTRPTKEVVVDSLTKDATVKACIFDLIDNSIDAARDTFFHHLTPAGKNQQLPASYGGYKIDLHFSGTSFKIEDNCGGIPVERLKDSVLRFGKKSSHKLGIGVFGVGLNRALFKLGVVSHLRTDTGRERAELLMNSADYLKSRDWNLPAQAFPSSGKIGTEIEITQLPSEIAKDFADAKWVDELRSELGRIYGRFIRKELELNVGGKSVKSQEVQIRDNGPYDSALTRKFYKAPNGVSIIIEHGQHKDHRFSNEKGYSQQRNSDLTDQYGWTIFCNDRAIVSSDRSPKTGWQRFHTEFYGFVGNVNFIGEPDKLPWKTTKNDIDANNPAYLLALGDMTKFAEQWRSFAEKRKKGAARGETLRSFPSKKANENSKGTKAEPLKAKIGQKPGAVAKAQEKPDHNRFREVLPEDIGQQHCVDKLLALVNEAKRLDVLDHPYSSLALIRMLFESSVVYYMDRHGKYDHLKQATIERRKKKGMKIVDEKKVTPSIDEMLAYFENNQSIWGSAKENHLRHCVSKMSGHQKAMNKVMHNPYQLTNKTEAIQIRDEVLPLLRHLIEK